MSLSRKRKKFIIGAFAAFLFLILFYRWQLAASSDYLNRGDRNYSGGDYDQALKDYKYAAAIDGDKNTVYLAELKRAEIFYSHGLLDKAEKELKKAFNNRKDDCRAYELGGDIFHSQREFDGAIEYYGGAIKLNDEERISVKMAKSFMAKGEMESARGVFLSLNSKNGKSEEVSYYLGLLDFYNNIFDSGYFKKLEEIGNEKHKDNIKKLEETAEVCDGSGSDIYKEAAAADFFNKINEPYLAANKISPALQNNPNYRDGWIIFGKSNFIIGDYEKSLESFNKALELDSHNPEVCFWLGSVHKKMGDISKAEEFFGRFEALKS